MPSDDCFPLAHECAISTTTTRAISKVIRIWNRISRNRPTSARLQSWIAILPVRSGPTCPFRLKPRWNHASRSDSNPIGQRSGLLALWRYASLSGLTILRERRAPLARSWWAGRITISLSHEKPRFLESLIPVAGAVLFFVYGLSVARYHIFPYSVLKFGEESFLEVFAQRGMLTGTRPEEHLSKARYEGNGVTHFDKDQAFPGFTLLSGFFDNGLELRLIRLDGSVVNRWPARFHDLIRDTSHIQPQDRVPRTDWNTAVLGAMAFPDGSILFNFEEGGLVKLDRCGAVQWTLPRMVHHSIDRAEEGGFWIPSIRYISRDSPFPLLIPPYKEETLMKVSSDGKVLQEISVPRLLFENNLTALLFANGQEGLKRYHPRI